MSANKKFARDFLMQQSMTPTVFRRKEVSHDDQQSPQPGFGPRLGRIRLCDAPGAQGGASELPRFDTIGRARGSGSDSF